MGMTIGIGVLAQLQKWLKKEESKGKIARAQMKSTTCGHELFLLERAQKADATAKVLRKVLKIIDNETSESYIRPPDTLGGYFPGQ